MKKRRRSVEVLVLCGFELFSVFLVCHFLQYNFYWLKLLRSKVLVLYTERIKQPTQIPSSVHGERRKKASKKGGKVVDIASNISEE